MDERLLTSDPNFFNICYREQQEEINLFSLVCMGSIVTSKFSKLVDDPPLPESSTKALIQSPCSVRRDARMCEANGN